MKELESDKLYSILVNIYYLDNGQPRGTSPKNEDPVVPIITGDSNVTLIGQNIYNALIRANNEYSLPESETMVQIGPMETLGQQRGSEEDPHKISRTIKQNSNS